MVFDNVTLFEVHFDDATFSPPFRADDDADHETVDAEGTDAPSDAAVRDTGGRGRLGAVVGLVVLAGVATAVVRRRRTTAEDGDGDADADIAVEDAAVEDAAADPVAQ
jgi:hypothetical protein